MNEIIPNSLKNKIDTKINSFQSANLIDRIKEYQNYLKEIKYLDNGTINFEKRLENSKYFLFDMEDSNDGMNCFEKSTSMYFVLKDYFPEFSPELINIDEKNRGIHSAVIFRKDNLIHIADPNYELFNPVLIKNDEIIVYDEKNNNEIIKKYDIDGLNFIDDKNLERKIKRLRNENGLVEFLSGGQVIFEEKESFFPYQYFINIDDNENLIVENRTFGFYKDLNLCFRYILNPFSKRVQNQFLQFEYENWAGLINDKLLMKKEFNLNETGKLAYNIEISNYNNLKNWEIMTTELHYLIELGIKRKKSKKKIEDVFLYSKYGRKEGLDYFVDRDGDDFSNYFNTLGDSYSKHFLDFSIHNTGFKYYLKKEENMNLRQYLRDIKVNNVKDFINLYVGVKLAFIDKQIVNLGHNIIPKIKEKLAEKLDIDLI